MGTPSDVQAIEGIDQYRYGFHDPEFGSLQIPQRS